jgi:hypothetical protein
MSGYVIPARGGPAKKFCSDCTVFGWLKDHRRAMVLRRGGVLSAGSSGGDAVDIVDPVSGGTQVALTGGRLLRPNLSWDNRWLAVEADHRIWNVPFRPGTPPDKPAWILVRSISETEPERHAGWSPDGRLLYLLLTLDGFRCLYAQRMDPDRGTPIGDPFLVQHFHDPRRQ